MVREQGADETNAILKNAGYDSVHERKFGEAKVPDAAQVRSKFAAFDPRFKDSPLLMSAVGGAPSASKLAAGALNPFRKAKQAYDQYDESVQKPVSNVAQKIASGIAQATTLPGISDEAAQKYQDSATGIVGTGLEIAMDPTNLVMPGLGAVSKVLKATKFGATAAKVLKGLKPVQFEKALAPEMLRVLPMSQAEQAIQHLKSADKALSGHKPVISNAAAKSNELLGGASTNKYIDAAEASGTAKAAVNANSRPDAGFGSIKVK
jgi:hypothetical protein